MKEVFLRGSGGEEIPFRYDEGGRMLFLGLGTGGVFALVSQLAPPDRVGSVTGVVGAAGGLGGFFPPLLMGAVHGATGDYSVGFVLLAVTALAALSYTWFVIRPRVL